MKTYKVEKYYNLISVILITLCLIVVSIADGFAAAGRVRGECLRLHILASSDSPEDQAVKLIVRDALLNESRGMFDGCKSSQDAVNIINENKEEIESIVNKVLREQGFSYGCSVKIENEYFETRQYDDVKLPAGEYTSCIVTLGEGEGKNWWCIMFPMLCIPAVSEEGSGDINAVFGQSGADLVTEKSGYKVKFKIVEWFGELFGK